MLKSQILVLFVSDKTQVADVYFRYRSWSPCKVDGLVVAAASVLARRGVVAAAEQPVHDGGEGGLELLVGHHVDDWVQGRVEVACRF